MIKKIQKYLLLNFPLFWNVKVVPVLLLALALNILLFAIGYASTNINFSERYYYDFINEGLSYFGMFLLFILILIVWIVNYSKNNSFKVFYPKKNYELYLEWILVFTCIVSLMLVPTSFKQGSNTKIKSYASKQETLDAVETINMVKLLLPSDKQEHFREYPNEIQQKEESEGSYYDSKVIDSISNSSLKKYDESLYPNFAQLSLLNKSTSYTEISDWRMRETNPNYESKGMETVRQWLIDENKTEVSKLMDIFLALLKKHNLKTNLDKNLWMKLMYNPKKYPVGDFNLVRLYYDKYDIENQTAYIVEEPAYNGNNINYKYYVQYQELSRAYSKISEVYSDTADTNIMYLVAVCFAGMLSLMVFSFRCTSGKDWLIAFVSGGLLIFINFMITLFIDEVFDWNSDDAFSIFFGIWICLFIAEMVFIGSK